MIYQRLYQTTGSNVVMSEGTGGLRASRGGSQPTVDLE